MSGVKAYAAGRPGSMSGNLIRTRDLVKYDHCCGIHGAARERAGIKHATVTARRRLAKEEIEQALQELELEEEEF